MDCLDSLHDFEFCLPALGGITGFTIIDGLLTGLAGDTLCVLPPGLSWLTLLIRGLEGAALLPRGLGGAACAGVAVGDFFDNNDLDLQAVALARIEALLGDNDRCDSVVKRCEPSVSFACISLCETLGGDARCESCIASTTFCEVRGERRTSWLGASRLGASRPGASRLGGPASSTLAAAAFAFNEFSSRCKRSHSTRVS